MIVVTDCGGIEMCVFGLVVVFLFFIFLIWLYATKRFYRRRRRRLSPGDQRDTAMNRVSSCRVLSVLQ